MTENRKRNAVVTLVIGAKYQGMYNKYFRKSHEKYAKSIDADFYVIQDHIEASKKHPTWQKLLMFRNAEIRGHERILFLDGDVYATKHANDPFKEVPAGQWGAVKNNAQNLPRLDVSDLGLMHQCPQENRPPYIINSGFMVLEPRHQPIMEKVFASYQDQSCGEQGTISYHLINEAKGHTLPWTFNAVIPDYMEKYGWKTSSFVSLFEQAGFIHSAGGMNKMALRLFRSFDNHPTILTIFKIVSRHSRLDTLLGKTMKSSHAIWWRWDAFLKRFNR